MNKMYCILIKDENGDISIYSIGENPKTYSTIKEAEQEIKELIDMEVKLFGNQVTKYIITNYTEEGID